MSTLPDVSFTNNLGTVTFQSCLLQFNEDMAWSGRSVKLTKEISVSATVMYTDAASQRLDAVLTDPTSGPGSFGEGGTLTLPWTVLTNVKLMGLTTAEGNWGGAQKVTATFVDDQPSSNTYTVHWFGMELHNPRVGVELPQRVLNDDYTQMSYQMFGLYDPSGFGNSVFRTKSAPSMISLSLGGTMFLDDGLMPDNWLSVLVQRANMDAASFTFTVPTGWPRSFPMSEACPEIAIAMPLTQIIGAGGTVIWNVEDASAELSVQLLCQPQYLEN